MKKLGENIRKFRIKVGLSQAALAKKLNLTTTTVYRLEKDHFKPSLDTVINLAKVLGTTTDLLLLSKEDSNKIMSSNKALAKRLEAIKKLNQKDEKTLFQIVDSFLKSR